MDINLIRKKIRNNYFSTGGLIIITVLGTIGLLMAYFSGIFDIEDSNMLYECISKNGMMIILILKQFAMKFLTFSVLQDFHVLQLPKKILIKYLTSPERWAVLTCTSQ